MATLPRFVRRILDRVAGPRSAAPNSSRGATGKSAPVRGRYDAAGTSDENRNHWGAADGLSANAAHSPAVRQILRNRSRYEAQNNGYCKGLLRTRRNDVVGTGPRLQATLPGEFTYHDTDFGTLNAVVPEGTASAVERKWVEWCDRIGLADKLRVLVETGDRDGETFAVMVNNPGFPADGPQLDVRLYEADQVTTPDLWWNDPLAVDGIRFPDGRKLAIKVGSIYETPDCAWLTTEDATLADLPFAEIASSNPPVGTKIWHKGYGVDNPGKLPPPTAEGDQRAREEDRLQHVRDLAAIVDQMFAAFMNRRMTSYWTQEVQEMGAWLRGVRPSRLAA